MMPKVMDNLMPHMIGDVVPLVTDPMIAYLKSEAAARGNGGGAAAASGTADEASAAAPGGNGGYGGPVAKGGTGTIRETGKTVAAEAPTSQAAATVGETTDTTLDDETTDEAPKAD